MCSKHGRVRTFINAEIGRGLFQVYTHIYFKDDFIAQSPTREGRERQQSSYLPCSDVLFFHSRSELFINYLLINYIRIVLLITGFFLFRKILFIHKKLFQVHWLGFLNIIVFYLVFFFTTNIFCLFE